MDRFRLIGRLLAIIAIVGLVVSPVVTPAAAGSLPMLMADDASMADMPCCPDTEKGNNCQDCPLPAMCTLAVAQLVPPSATVILRHPATRHLFAAHDDPKLDGLGGRPPDHPPRHLI